MDNVSTGARVRPSALIGRTEDVRRIETLLGDGARLVTLRGPGGIGKTTLAAHLGRTLHDAFDHVLFVDLTAERDPRRVLDVVAAHLPDVESRSDAFRRLVAFVEERRVLLILDNFEQVVEAAVDVSRLIGATATLQVLITSRVTLRVHDEQEVEVFPLTLPGASGRDTASSAERLFVQRARQVNVTFELDDEARPLVADIVTRLEGVPLAIELAASRLRTFTLPDLLARLEHPLQVLKADFRDRPERLRSLRGAVQWSYDLLSEEDRAVFECCAVFEGSFTPEALVAVWGGEEVLDRVEHLLEQSFLQRVNAAVTRWKMLQPLRELALEQLRHHPSAEEWRERHSLYFLHVLEDMRKGQPGPHPRARELYLPDYPNMRAGLVWATRHERVEVALRYLDGIALVWAPFGIHQDGRQLTEAVLRLPASGFEKLRMRGLTVLAEVLYSLSDMPAMEECMREHHALSEVHGTDEDRAWSKIGLSIVLWVNDEYEEALRLNQQVIDWFEAGSDTEPASYRASMAYATATGNSVHPLMSTGQFDVALERAVQSVERYQRAGTDRATTQRVAIGMVLLHLNRPREAIVEFHVAFRHAIKKGLVADTGSAAWGFVPLMVEPRPLLAASFAGFARRREMSAIDSFLRTWREQAIEEVRARLSPEDFQAAWQAGERWTPEEALKHADAFVAEGVLEPTPPREPPTERAPDTHGLTAREVQVLELVAAGHPDRRVAKLLNISPTTASKHVSNILSKLGLRNRTELARWAAEQQARP